MVSFCTAMMLKMFLLYVLKLQRKKTRLYWPLSVVQWCKQMIQKIQFDQKTFQLQQKLSSFPLIASHVSFFLSPTLYAHLTLSSRKTNFYGRKFIFILCWMLICLHDFPSATNHPIHPSLLSTINNFPLEVSAGIFKWHIYETVFHFFLFSSERIGNW